MDMTNFAGTATGQTREEQVFILNQWVTYRTRGGPSTIDGFFSPTTKTPYTDELQFQYEVDLGHNMSASATYYNRQTRDIFEDFDPALYTEPSAYPGDINDPNTLFLGWDYFGWTATNHPAANFFLGTLPGQRAELQRARAGVPQAVRGPLAGAGVLQLPRRDRQRDLGRQRRLRGRRALARSAGAQHQGTVAGTIHSLFKAGGSYTTQWDLELGAGYRWNSGTIVNTDASSPRTVVCRSRVRRRSRTRERPTSGLPTAPLARCRTRRGASWICAFSTSSRSATLTAEVFMDLFNVTNNQGAIRLQDLAAGSGTTKYLDEFVWLRPAERVPRRADPFLGARCRVRL